MFKKMFYLIPLTASLLTTTLHATPSPDVIAEGAVLLEATTGQVLYAKNPFYQFYPASTTKVLTTLLLAEHLVDDAVITKSQDSVNHVPSDSSHIGLRVGDTYSYIDGLHAILMRSDNFVSHDMGIYTSGSTEQFAQLMNTRAEAIGTYDTHFMNAHGYHDPNHYTTPFDLAKLTEEAFNNTLVEKIAGTSTYDFTILNSGTTLTLEHTAPFFNSDSSYYNPSIVAAKTGFHTPAGRTLVAKATEGDMELIAVVMHSGSPDYFKDINKLINYGLTNFDIQVTDTGLYTLLNTSYSEWAEPTIQHAISNGFYKPSALNYMDPISTSDFLTLLHHRLHIAQAPLPSIVAPLDPTLAQSIFSKLALLYSHNLPDTFVQDTLNTQGIETPTFISTEMALVLQEHFLQYLFSMDGLALTADLLETY